MIAVAAAKAATVGMISHPSMFCSTSAPAKRQNAILVTMQMTSIIAEKNSRASLRYRRSRNSGIVNTRFLR